MAKQVFFSFHYEDVKTFRANVVRNHGFTKANGQETGFFDASIWEDAKKHGADSVKRLINSNLDGTTATCVLIGSETWKRRWVRYEILKSYDRGNALFGVHINSIADKNKQTFLQGKNPFDYLGFVISENGKKRIYYEYYEYDGVLSGNIYQDLSAKSVNYDKQYWDKGFMLSNWVKCYDWTSGDGYNNFATWLENAGQSIPEIINMSL